MRCLPQSDCIVTDAGDKVPRILAPTNCEDSPALKTGGGGRGSVPWLEDLHDGEGYPRFRGDSTMEEYAIDTQSLGINSSRRLSCTASEKQDD